MFFFHDLNLGLIRYRKKYLYRQSVNLKNNVFIAEEEDYRTACYLKGLG